MRNNKGFALLELIVVMAILGVLAVVTVPTLTQYIDSSRKGVCEASRAALIRSFTVFKASDDNNYTLEDVVKGNCPAMLNDYNNLNCPADGTFSVVDGNIVCSIHDVSGTSGVLKAGDTILNSVVLDDLRASCVIADESAKQGIHLTAKGQVLVANGVTYAVGWSTWLSQDEAEAFLNNGTIPSIFVKIDTVNILSSSNCNYVNYHWVWTPAVEHGSVYYDSVNKVSYFYNTTGGATDQLPENGGNWIRLS